MPTLTSVHLLGTGLEVVECWRAFLGVLAFLPDLRCDLRKRKRGEQLFVDMVESQFAEWWNSVIEGSNALKCTPASRY